MWQPNNTATPIWVTTYSFMIILSFLATGVTAGCSDAADCNSCFDEGACFWCFTEETAQAEISKKGNCQSTDDCTFFFRRESSCPAYREQWMGMDKDLTVFLVIFLPILLAIGIAVGICCFLHHWKIESSKNLREIQAAADDARLQAKYGAAIESQRQELKDRDPGSTMENFQAAFSAAQGEEKNEDNFVRERNERLKRLAACGVIDAPKRGAGAGQLMAQGKEKDNHGSDSERQRGFGGMAPLEPHLEGLNPFGDPATLSAWRPLPFVDDDEDELDIEEDEDDLDAEEGCIDDEEPYDIDAIDNASAGVALEATEHNVSKGVAAGSATGDESWRQIPQTESSRPRGIDEVVLQTANVSELVTGDAASDPDQPGPKMFAGSALANEDIERIESQHRPGVQQMTMMEPHEPKPMVFMV